MTIDAPVVASNSPATATDQPFVDDAVELVVTAGRSSQQYWRDLWRYRELFFFLAWRDFAVRYKQTAIGVAWALLRPLLTMIVFTVIFGGLAKMPAPDGVPYPLLVMSGMLPWTFFSAAMSESAASILANANLISKVYFPRLITPAAVVLVTFVDLAISGLLMLGLMLYFGRLPPWQIVVLPLFLVQALAAALGVGLWLSALTVKYRDFRFVVPFLVQFGLYISPVGFSSDVVPTSWRTAFALNPIVGVIEGFRWTLLGTSLHFVDVGLSLIVTVAVLATGFRYFRATERQFADTI